MKKWNLYFDVWKCFLDDEEHGKIFLQLAGSVHKNPRMDKGFTVRLRIWKLSIIMTFTRDHEKYVNTITQNGRWRFDDYQLRRLPLPVRISNGLSK